MKRGDQGEKLAVSHLMGLGFRIEELNWRAGRHGEIDIIAYDGDILVFVEVKAREAGSLEGPLEAVTAAKRKKLLNLSREYLYRRGLYGQVDCRFDVIGITCHPNGHELQHIRDAFRE